MSHQSCACHGAVREERHAFHPPMMPSAQLPPQEAAQQVQQFPGHDSGEPIPERASEKTRRPSRRHYCDMSYNLCPPYGVDQTFVHPPVWGAFHAHALSPGYPCCRPHTHETSHMVPKPELAEEHPPIEQHLQETSTHHQQPPSQPQQAPCHQEAREPGQPLSNQHPPHHQQSCSQQMQHQELPPHPQQPPCPQQPHHHEEPLLPQEPRDFQSLHPHRGTGEPRWEKSPVARSPERVVHGHEGHGYWSGHLPYPPQPLHCCRFGEDPHLRGRPPVYGEFHVHSPGYSCCQPHVHQEPHKQPPHPCRERPRPSHAESTQTGKSTRNVEPVLGVVIDECSDEGQDTSSKQHHHHHECGQHRTPHQGGGDVEPEGDRCAQPPQPLTPDDFISFRENPTHEGYKPSRPVAAATIDPCTRAPPAVAQEMATSAQPPARQQPRNAVYSTSPQYEELVPVPCSRPIASPPSNFNHLSFKDKQLVMAVLRKTAPSVQASSLFAEKDKNNCGKISKRDFEIVMDKLGVLKDLSSREMDAIFRGFPATTDAVLDYKKYICACKEVLSKPEPFK